MGRSQPQKPLSRNNVIPSRKVHLSTTIQPNIVAKVEVWKRTRKRTK